jgi:hypothetical protein
MEKIENISEKKYLKKIKILLHEFGDLEFSWLN